MESLNQSLEGAVCIDEEVFFGPITDKERKVREQFETLHGNGLNIVETSKAVEDDESHNYSSYKSFSVEESKYDSFDDSLNEGMDKMPQESKLITVRKSYDKIKSKKSGFYDSLEDVCSLISNIDKCSISCDVENESNLNSKHFVEDSLKVLSVPAANKNNFISDQVHFDDDSLAILECEATFSDSLEEVNVLESIEVEEINDIESINVENQNVLFTLEQHAICPPKNLFDTSVEIVCEKKKDSDTTDQEESLDDKNALYDSLSNSDFKDILTDSLDESKQIKEKLSLTKPATINIVHDKEKAMEKQNNQLFNVDQDYVHSLPNLFDTSVQIICEKVACPKDIVTDKNILCDSLSNSEVKDISKDSLEESVKSNEILNVSHQSKDDIVKLENVFLKQNTLDTSVQIVYDNSSDCFETKHICEGTNNFKENFENSKSFQETSADQNKIEISTEQSSIIKSTCMTQSLCKNTDANKILFSNSDNNGDNKVKPDMSVASDTALTTSINDALDFKKETFSLDSCHLKILNDDINIDKDLKFQLHIEVTVGDKKCQIASEDIKIIPTNQNYKSENDSVSATSVVNSASNSSTNSEYVAQLSNPEINLSNKDHDIVKVQSPVERNLSSVKKSETAFTSNVTLRPKSSASQNLCTKLTCLDSFNDISLLQALDLSDISVSFLNESVIQSKDPLIPLNLYSPQECLQNFHASHFKSKNKENIPEHMQILKNENFCIKEKNISPNKICNYKTPQSLQKCSSFKETSKKTPGTKIPIRKIDNFAIPASTPNKSTKMLATTLSAEKTKKCQHSPHSVDSNKKTPGTTPNKIPHICKVRNTIFSKVPQFMPSKKYMNIQSPVAQYIKSNSGPVKIPGIDPVLRDCMNHLMESPHHLHPTHTSGPLKSSKKKA